jgi:tRNA G18 (ribose-2'-O)-methylase SpoU
VALHIEDPDDARLADYRNVPDRALLDAGGIFVAEGRLVVRRLLSSTRFRARSLLLTDAAWRAIEQDLAHAGDLPVYVVSQAVMDTVAGFGVHRGCLAIGERPSPVDWLDLARDARQLVVLEHVTDADNVGAIFRNSAAFGVDAVLLGPATTDPLYRKAIRTSMAASLAVPFAAAEPWPDALHALREMNVAVIGLAPSAPVTLEDLAGAIRGRPAAIVAGHEGDGLSGAALDACEFTARIPMSTGVDSLNVATAVAIGLYELTRARRSSAD